MKRVSDADRKYVYKMIAKNWYNKTGNKNNNNIKNLKIEYRQKISKAKTFKNLSKIMNNAVNEIVTVPIKITRKN